MKDDNNSGTHTHMYTLHCAKVLDTLLCLDLDSCLCNVFLIIESVKTLKISKYYLSMNKQKVRNVSEKILVCQ